MQVKTCQAKNKGNKMNENNNDFPQGIFYKLPHNNAPDFIKGKVSIKLQEAITYLTGMAQTGEQWLNLDIKISKGGKGYLAVDTWKPQQQQQGYPQQQQQQQQSYQQPPQQTGQQQQDPFPNSPQGNAPFPTDENGNDFF
jgi:hypothetical protein